MSFFSRSSGSSRGKHFKGANYGSSRYKRKGVLGNLFNLVVSRTGAGGYYERTPKQNFHQTGHAANAAQGMKCGSCGSGIPAGSKFCLNCGSKVNGTVFCSDCGEKVPAGSKFCLKCGKRLQG